MPNLRHTTSMQVMHIRTMSSQPVAIGDALERALDRVADGEESAHRPRSWSKRVPRGRAHAARAGISSDEVVYFR